MSEDELRAKLDAANQRIAELEQELEESTVWGPVESGFKYESVYTVEYNGEWWLAISGEARLLPDNIRLFRRKDAQS